LLVTPFVARTFCNLRELPHELRAFAVLGLLFAGLSYLSANTGVAIGWALPWGVAFFVYCLGPSVLPREALAGRTRAFALVGALVSWMACVGLGMAGWTAQLYDNCPFFVVLAISLFVIVLDVAREWTPRAAVSFVAKHSFGVYLCHMLVLSRWSGFVRDRLGLGDAGVLGVWTTPVQILLTAVCSFVCVAVVAVLLKKIPKVGKYIMG
jgi:peptidoglycan/LPS O-acetylase OafA/YrhL